MQPVIPYQRAANTLMRYGKYSVPPYLRTAAQFGSYAYKYRNNIYKTGRFAKRVYKRATKKRKREPDTRAYESNLRSKIHDVFQPDNVNYTSVGQKTLALSSVRMPNSDGQNPMARLTNQIYVKGVSFCIDLFNVGTFPIEVHFALIQFANENVTDDEVNDDFFRGETTGGAPNLSFQDYTVSPSFDQRYKCNSLNPDNKRIITHQKYVLGKQDTRSLVQSGYHHKVDQYFPIHRYVSFDNRTDTQTERPLKWCMWAMPVDGADFNTSGQIDLFKYQLRSKVYFRNEV